jgi:ElaB/YqjD/DUF883 family membrane-anchored ribosome-binding protein
MTADAVVSRELQSLREELSDAQRGRLAAPDAGGSAASAAEPSNETEEGRELRDQLRELADEVTGFFAEAEKSISAHPAQSVIGALLVGILIGRLLARR